MLFPLDIEFERFLIADQSWAVVQRVEVRGEKGVRFTGNRIEPGCDARPVLRQLKSNGGRMLQLTRNVQEHPCRCDEGAVLTKIVLRGESLSAQNIVVHDKRRRVAVS